MHGRRRETDRAAEQVDGDGKTRTLYVRTTRTVAVAVTHEIEMTIDRPTVLKQWLCYGTHLSLHIASRIKSKYSLYT